MNKNVVLKHSKQSRPSIKNFSVYSQMVNILRFMGHMPYCNYSTLPLCMKEVIDYKCRNRYGYVPVKLYLPKKAPSWIQLAGVVC